jgi:uncharacterized surface protein with fasciclin (FAS1) repeats
VKVAPVDWEYSFDKESKQPFGTYVLFNEIQHILPEHKVEILSWDDMQVKMYESELNSVFTPKTLLLIADELKDSYGRLKTITDWVRKGNDAYISLRLMKSNFKRLTDNKAKREIVMYYHVNDSNYLFTSLTDSLLLTKGIISYHFMAEKDSFSDIQYMKAVGDTSYLKSKVSFKLENGNITVNNFPFAFTNYFLLNENEAYREYAVSELQKLSKDKTIYLVHTFNKKLSRLSGSKLRFIQKHPALLNSWRILILGLLIYVIFRAKRHQRIIPEIQPFTNDSKEFVKTIGNLHWEKENYRTLLDKQITYFLTVLKEDYQIDGHTPDSRFKELVIRKTQCSEKDIDIVIKSLKYLKNNGEVSEYYLMQVSKAVNNIINTK